MKPLILTALLFLCLACKHKPVDSMTENDPHSSTEYKVARVNSLDWDAELDFENKQIKATALWRFKAENGAKFIYFDSKNLTIEDISDNNGSIKGWELINQKYSWLGESLKIPINDKSVFIKIRYTTSKEADALQWLEKTQTSDKKGPFLFTQSQAILARTWLPCQDSPGIRFNYKARVKVPKGMLALMSANNPTKINPAGIYTFEQANPIPSYLMALAVGHLAFEAIDQKSGVYAEESMLKKSVEEFSELPKMIQAAEDLYGPYSWGKYDILVLPPSFPFGGMENPVLTFATPTIIAGDKSLTSLIAHELAHSWSGNLVTNANWNDFWLNEGFTVYFERRIMESIYGKEYAEMLASLGYKDLESTLKDLGNTNEDTRLKLKLEDRNPDDGMNDIAYEKGYFLLRSIESEVGRSAMDTFLRRYFNRFAFQQMTTEKFISYLKKELISEEVYLKLKIDQWIYEAGVPENINIPKSERFARVEKSVADWREKKQLSPELTNAWSSHEWLHFIRKMSEQINVQEMELLDQQFGFTQSGNSEILFEWFKLGINKKYQPCFPSLEIFLNTVGRRKFILPLYKSLMANDYSDFAKRVYSASRMNYHAVATQSIDPIIK